MIKISISYVVKYLNNTEAFSLIEFEISKNFLRNNDFTHLTLCLSTKSPVISHSLLSSLYSSSEINSSENFSFSV